MSQNSTENISRIAVPSPRPNDENNDSNDLHHNVTHAYQIPQQSNVGSGSIFLLSSSRPLSIKTNSKKFDRRYSGNKSLSYPFYTMYFTNLTTQQSPNDYKKNYRTSLSTSTQRIGKTTVKSHINTPYTRHSSPEKLVKSSMNIRTYTATNNDYLKTSYYDNKAFSAKIAAFESENSHLLKDILRTTSWNHVKV